jgi:hypothetical protein
MCSGVASRLRSPTTWLLVGIAALRVVGIGWGLPASDGWDNDGVALRDFLPGPVDSFTSGRFYTCIRRCISRSLAVATSPITLLGVRRAPSRTLAALVQHFPQVPYMTGYRLAHESTYASRFLRRVEINASLACPVYVFERKL